MSGPGRSDAEIAEQQAYRLLKLLEARGWDLDKLAEETGVDRGLLGRWADATDSPPIVTVAHVLQVLAPDADRKQLILYAIGLRDSPEPSPSGEE